MRSGMDEEFCDGWHGERWSSAAAATAYDATLACFCRFSARTTKFRQRVFAFWLLLVDVGRISRIFSFCCRREQQPGGGGVEEDDGSCTDVSGKGHLWWREFISSSSISGFFIFSRPIGDDGGRPIMLPKGYVGIQRPHSVWRLHLLHQQILSPGLIPFFSPHNMIPKFDNCVSKTHESCGKKQHFIFEVLGLLHAAGENSNNKKIKSKSFLQGLWIALFGKIN